MTEKQTYPIRTAADAHAEDMEDLAWMKQGLERDKTNPDPYIQAGHVAVTEYLHVNNDSNLISHPEVPTPLVNPPSTSEK